MTRLRVGVIGAGTISQVEHIPNLSAFSTCSSLSASPIIEDRPAVHQGHLRHPRLRNSRSPVRQKLDAVVFGSPDPLHYEQVLAALARGLHVFCEKPLCYSPSKIADIIAARDASQKIVQVGYMKRFDPSYRHALTVLPGTAKTLRYISVEVNDPDAGRSSAIPAQIGNDIPGE